MSLRFWFVKTLFEAIVWEELEPAVEVPVRLTGR